MTRNTKMEQILIVKQIFEHKLSKYNVSIKRYYTDNDYFVKKRILGQDPLSKLMYSILYSRSPLSK